MDKLRILPLAFICGLLTTPAFAQPITIGPETPGVSQSQVSLVNKGTPCNDSEPSNCIYASPISDQSTPFHRAGEEPTFCVP